MHGNKKIGIFMVLISLIAISSSTPSDRSLDMIIAEIPSKLDLDNSNIRDTAATITIDYPGEYSINQVSAIYNTLAQGGWYYYSDPNDQDYFQNANRSLQLGKISNTIGQGDCDDFAILMASLIQSIGGSTRITFAYDNLNKTSHAYAEVYLGKEKNPQVENILNWIKDEYAINEIPGINKTGDEIWLNLDWGSNSTIAAYLGGRYAGEGRSMIYAPIAWQSKEKISPKIVPTIDTLDSTNGWKTIKNYYESSINISAHPARKGNGLQISYNLTEGGWVGISKHVGAAPLLNSTGLAFFCFCIGNQDKLELRMVCKNGEAFSVSRSIPLKETWSSQMILYSDFKLVSQANGRISNRTKLNLSEVEKIEFIIPHPSNIAAGYGSIVLDDLRGIMAIPVGSPADVAEKQRKKASATEYALISEKSFGTDILKSTKLAVESISSFDTLAGRQALRKSLELILFPEYFLKNNGIVQKIAFSPNGRLLATAGERGGKVWDVATGKEISELDFNSWLYAMDFSPDSTRIVTANNDNSSYLWNAASGRMLSKMDHGGAVNAAIFSPDGRYIATASDDNTTRLWNASGDAELSRITLDGRVYALAFSPDSSLLAAAFFNDKSASKERISYDPSLDNAVVVWNISGHKLTKIELHSDINAIGFNSDGSLLATGSWDGLACIFDSASGNERKKIELGSAVTSIAFQPGSNRFAVGSWDNTARIYDLSDEYELIRVSHDDFINCVAFSPDGKLLATAGDDNTARVWQSDNGKELYRIRHDGMVTALSFCPDGRLIATASRDEIARIWNSSRLTEPKRMYHDASIITSAISHDDRFLATAAADNCAYIWDMATAKELTEIKHDGFVNALAFSPDDSMIATAGEDKTACIWNSTTGLELLRLKNEGAVNTVAFSPDGSRLATGSNDNTARLWDVSTGKEVLKMNHHAGVHTVAFSPDGRRLATAAYDNTARIWNMTTGREVARMSHDDDRWVCSLAFSPDGRRLATASSDKTARIWDAETGKEILRFAHDKWVLHVAFSPDGERVATSCIDNTACIWNSTRGSRLTILNHEAKNDHDNEVRDIIFSPDGKCVATAGDDGTARIWNASTGEEIDRMEHDEKVKSIHFTHDGKRFITASDDCTCAVWLLKSRDLICDVCARLSFNATTDDWMDLYCNKCDALMKSSQNSVSIAPNQVTNDQTPSKPLAQPQISSYQSISNEDKSSKTWIKTFGGAKYEDGMTIRQTHDGGYIISGNTHSYKNGGAWLVKLDSMGNKLWDKVFGESSFQFGSSVRETSDAGYIIAGRTNEGRDTWLIKTDVNGDEIWQKSFNNSFGSSVRQTKDRGYIITGSKSFKSTLLLKTDSNGDMIWDRSLDASNDFEFNEGESVEETGDGGYLIAGTSTKQLQNSDNNPRGSLEAFKKDAWLIKTDEEGYIVWDDILIREGNTEGRWALQTQDAQSVFIGSIESNSTTGKDLWLIKTDAQGKIIWEKVFGGQGDDEGVCLQQTNDGGFIILGNTKSFNALDQDLWLIKIDAQGNKLWDRTYGESGDDSGAEVQQTADGGYIIIGTIYYSDFYVIKTDASGNV